MIHSGRMLDHTQHTADLQPVAFAHVVSLVGDRLADLDEGAEVQVKGTLRIIHHPPTVVNGVLVDTWAGDPG